MPNHSLTRTLTIGGAAAAALALVVAAPATASTAEVAEPETFTSAFTVWATGDEIIDNEGEPVPGEEGATGQFDLRINSEDEIICFDITLSGVTGEYQSPADTATHIHESAAGDFGPPRIAFPDPSDNGDGTRTSSGCLQGPFATGLDDDEGVDTGEGFSLAEIEANPAGFAADTHTAGFTAGAVRGQLTQVPVGGVATGGGGAAGSDVALAGLLGAGALAIVGAGGVLVAASRRTVRAR